MKAITLAFLLLFFAGKVLCQTDDQGDIVFNSITINEKEMGDFILVSNYYTLSNNIENKLSSAYVADKPSLDQIETAALELPSDFFMLAKDGKLVVFILLLEDPKREFLTIALADQEETSYACTLVGEIMENRANEIIKEGYDPNASIADGKLTFNGKDFAIISNKVIEEAVLQLIEKEKLNDKPVSDIVFRSQKHLEEYVLNESKEGGKLDFFTEIKGKETDGIQIKPGVFSTRKGVALYKWGSACFEIGISTLGDAIEIFKKIQGKEVSERDKKYIKMGFYNELSK